MMQTNTGVVTLPYNFDPRLYQKEPMAAMDLGYRRVFFAMHRRAGKDLTCLNILAKEAMKRKGLYLYMLPYYKQARIIVWEGMRGDGFKLLDHFPDDIVKRRENQQMVLELTNGSIIRFCGSDNIDSIVGTNPIGVVFSEFSLHKPQAYHYLRPIIVENGGWMVFQGTPRGKNLFWKTRQLAKKSSDWFFAEYTVDDTKRHDGSPVITPEDIEIERQSGMPEELIQQEYYCSYEAGLVGSYWGDLFAEASEEKRITRVPWEPSLPVMTAWDLGYNDDNTIIFFQLSGREVWTIDAYDNRTKPLGHYVNLLNRKPYTYSEHFLPHDVEVHELSTGVTRRETLEDLGLTNITTIPRMGTKGLGIQEGVNAVRQMLPKTYFDAKKCDDLIEAGKSFRREWDEKNQVFRDNYVHDWASHYASALIQMARGVAMIGGQSNIMYPYQDNQYDELGDTYYQEQMEMHREYEHSGQYNELDDYLD